MKRLLLTLLFTSSCFIFISLPKAYSATIKGGESVYISEDEKNLRDLYLFGETVTLDAPVENDLTSAGGTVTLNGDVAGSIFAAGGDVFIRSNTKNTLRVAGGNVVISGEIGNDVLLAGGNIRLTKEASVSGDLMIAGGEIQIHSPIEGDIYVNGGNVLINSKVGGNIEGNIENLIFGSNAQVLGNLKYKANKKAVVSNGAVVRGRHDFRMAEENKSEAKELLSAFGPGAVYKLAADIIICLLLLTFLSLFTKNILESILNSPVASAGRGLLFIFIWPVISIFLLFLLWLGIMSFLLYGIVIVVSLFVGKIFLGWFILHHWEKRKKIDYALDWKAAVVGPIAFFVLLLIPILGWIAVFIIYLMAVGGIINQFLAFTKIQKITKKS